MTTRVGAVDNHPVVLDGLRAALARVAPDLPVVATAGSVEELLAGPVTDVVLLDIGMPDQPGVEESVRRLVAAGRLVLLFTAEKRPVPIRRGIAAGAQGLVLKVDPLEAVAAAIRDAVAGQLACSGPLAAMLLTDTTIGTRLTPATGGDPRGDQRRPALQAGGEAAGHRGGDTHRQR